MKYPHMVTIKGFASQWSILTELTPDAAADMRHDGLDVSRVFNAVPKWVADLGLARPWCFAGDLLAFRNPFRS